MLSEGIQVQIMRAMAGGFNALSVPEDYEGEAQPHRPADRRRRQPEGGPVDPAHQQKYALTPTGRARLPTADGIELWLLKAPGGPLPYDDRRSKRAIELLSEAWGHGLAHTLAAGPVEPAAAIAGCELRPRAAKRLLSKLCRTGLVEVLAGAGKVELCAPTEWLRRAVGALTLGARVESDDRPAGARPVDALDFVATVQLAAPLVRLGEEAGGACRLVLRLGPAGRRHPVGVTVEVVEGRIVSCEPDPESASETATEAVGELGAWFSALIDQRPKRLRFEGDRQFARDLVAAFGKALFDEPSFAR
ncbi:MAG: hypothetical protein WDZ46_02190 [Solirubrobacterales bacterium]